MLASVGALFDFAIILQRLPDHRTSFERSSSPNLFSGLCGKTVCGVLVQDALYADLYRGLSFASRESR
jgi:hypothetical protein